MAIRKMCRARKGASSGRDNSAEGPRDSLGAWGAESTPRGRPLRVALILLFCSGLSLTALQGMLASPASATAALPPAPLTLISRGLPAYASSSRGQLAGAANDGDYATYWRSSGTPAWLAYDLSGVPVERRGNVVLAWYNDPITPDYSHTLTRISPTTCQLLTQLRRTAPAVAIHQPTAGRY